MDRQENYNAFKGNPKLGIKTGLQRPKPLKASTENRLNFQSKPDISGNNGSSQNDNSPYGTGPSASSQNIPEGKEQ